MAKQTVVTVTDDLDGTNNAQTVSFGFDGSNYEIDLGKRNLAAFEKAMAPYVDAARKVRSGGGRSARTARAGGKRNDLQEIREWARANGYDVSERGRIANTVVEAYQAAQ